MPFGLNKAHALYQALFGQAENLIKGKHLLAGSIRCIDAIALPGAGDGAAQEGGHKSAAWLACSHALTVLPAVSSLKALRRTGHRAPPQR